MKLFKGILAIAIISMLFVSCKEVKKGANAVKDGVENVADKTADAAKKGANAVKDGVETAANKTADAAKGVAGDVKDAVTGHKCEPGCTKACCTKDAHKCSDAKCSADCKDATCTKCAAKKASCKTSCAAKKA